jgi:hypothetical protein
MRSCSCCAAMVCGRQQLARTYLPPDPVRSFM